MKKKTFGFVIITCACTCLFACIYLGVLLLGDNISTEKASDEKPKVSSIIATTTIATTTIATTTTVLPKTFMEYFTWKNGQITETNGKKWDFYAYVDKENFPPALNYMDADFCFLTHNTINLFAERKSSDEELRLKDTEPVKEVEIAYYSLNDGGIVPAFYYDMQRKEKIDAPLIYRPAYTGATSDITESVIMRYEDAVRLGYIKRNSNTISFKEES